MRTSVAQIVSSMPSPSDRPIEMQKPGQLLALIGRYSGVYM